jgi:hypothetical protein
MDIAKPDPRIAPMKKPKLILLSPMRGSKMRRVEIVKGPPGRAAGGTGFGSYLRHSRRRF